MALTGGPFPSIKVGHSALSKARQVHRYHLQDDASLRSSTTVVQRLVHGGLQLVLPPFASQRVEPTQVAHFYGRSVRPPYPRYIRVDGTLDFAWPASKELVA
jgi:hypothetical protein